MLAAVELDHVREIKSALTRTDHLSRAVAGLLVRASALRFEVRVADIYSDTMWPEKASIARASVTYVLRTSLEFSTQDIALLLCTSRRSISRDVQRIEDRREGDQALDHFIGELENAVKADVSG